MTNASYFFIEEYEYNTLYQQVCLDEGVLGDFFRNIKNKSLSYINSFLSNKKKTIEKYKRDKEVFLKKNGVKLEPFKKNIKKIILKYKDSAVVAAKKGDVKKLTEIVKDAALESKTVFQIFFDIKSFTVEGIAKALLIFTLLFILGTLINSIFAVVFSLLFPVEIAVTLTSLAIVLIQAPIVEESSKYLAIRQKSGGEFLLMFNIVEFSLYMNVLLSKGVPLFIALLARLQTVGMHYSTAFLQYRMQSADKGKLGLFLGMVLHACWNLLSVLTAV